MRAKDHAAPCIREGTLAGLGLALADGLASGIQRTPGKILLASAVAGALLGLGAGALGALARRRGLALGVVVGAGILVLGLATVSKEVAGTGARALSAACVLALAALAPVASVRAARARASSAWGWIALASVPASALLLHELERWTLARFVVLLLPLFVLELARRLGPRGRRAALLSAALAVPLLALPVTLIERAPARERLPPPPPPAEPARASVVLLVIDTLRADALAPDGGLARFAKQGVTFRQAISAAPWTLPSIGSLLTGLHPSQHGAVAIDTRLSGEIDTWAELLRARGLATAAFTGGAFVGASHGLDQGFETFDPEAERRFAPFRVHVPLVWRLAKNRYLPARALVRWVDEFRGLAGVLDAARVWGERREPDGRAFFLFLHTYQVHDYYLRDPDVDDAVLARAPAPSARFAGRFSVHPEELVGASQADLDHFHAIYAGRVAAVEALVPELERTVAALADGRPVLWIVTADHGEGFDAAQRRVHHGGRLHDDLLRVPLVLRYDGVLPAGVVIEEQVSTTDLLPTVLELAGAPVPAGLAGRSLVPALLGDAPLPPDAWSEERAGPPQRALRQGGWKRTETAAGAQCFDLARDPNETTSLPDSAELRAACAEFERRFPPRASSSAELDAETLEHLRALGYVR